MILGENVRGREGDSWERNMRSMCCAAKGEFVYGWKGKGW